MATHITYQFGKPLVLERHKKKGKKKKRRSRIAADIRQSEKHLLRGMERTIQALDLGLQQYRQASKKSAKKGEDEPLVDFVPNVAAGTAVMLRELALVPLDVMRAANTPQARQLIRRSLKATLRARDD